MVKKTKLFTELTLGYKFGKQVFGPGDFLTAQNNVQQTNDVLFVHMIKDFSYNKETEDLSVEYIVENIHHQERDRYAETERLMNPKHPLFVSLDVPLKDIAEGTVTAHTFTGEIFENNGKDIPVVLEKVVTRGVYRLDFIEKEGEQFVRVHVKAEPLVPVSEQIKNDITKTITKSKLNVVK